VRVLFDQGTPPPLRQVLSGHEEANGFGVLVTTDRQLKYQQDLASRAIAIVVLGTTSWPRIQAPTHAAVGAVNAATARSYAEVLVP